MKTLCESSTPSPTVDETLGLITGAAVFSKLDANSDFCQIPLHSESHLLTTFIMSFGGYCFNKLPFRISGSQEHFQKRMSNFSVGWRVCSAQLMMC